MAIVRFGLVLSEATRRHIEFRQSPHSGHSLMTRPLPFENHFSVYTHEHMVMKTCRHGTLLFNQQDTFVGRSLDLYGEWCEAEIDLLAQVLKPSDVVLDVGANIGSHTVPFAKLVGESGRVVAFEPQRLVFQNLCANLALNALRNVVTYDAGVGKDAGWMHLPVFDPLKKTSIPITSSATQKIFSSPFSLRRICCVFTRIRLLRSLVCCL
jgi:FkbM family methyltransferase